MVAAERVNSDDWVQEAAADLLAAIDEARFAFASAVNDPFYEPITGMSIFWPDVPSYLEEYQDLLLSTDTTWDNLLLAYYGY